MERHVKERLVGAAVLMAAAIILIPEMLSGPDRHANEPARRAADATAVKTYTIDLNRPPGTPQELAVPEQSAAPPPEKEQPLAIDQPASHAPDPARANEVDPESGVDPAPASPAAASSESSPRAATTPDNPKPDASRPRSVPAAQEDAPPAPASQPAVPTTRGWAVQLGSFSSRASAERLAAELRAERYEVFVMPVQTGKSTLYRVRIGPMRDRAGADETLRRVKSRIAAAAVVAHP